MDKRLFTSSLAPDERAKHAYFTHKHQDEVVLIFLSALLLK
jgi:hypothetical protein